MNELEAFYSDLYDGSTCVDMGSFSSFLSDFNETPSLVEERKNVCEGKLGYGECYNALQTFQKNKSPGNDGLAVEFYLAFWPASSKHIFWAFLAKKQTTPTAKEKLSAKYHHLTIDWKRVYLLSFLTTLETKLREFQFKILNRIVFTNEKLFRFGMAESDKCAFCQTEVESIEHLLFSCKISSVFWKYVLSWLGDNNIIVENLKEEAIIFGKFDVGDDFLLVNHILLLGKYYIYSQKCQKGMPSLQGFIARTRRVYNIELYIARKRGTLNKHLSKWEKLINIM